MKKVSYIIMFAALSVLTLTGCTKKYVYPTDDNSKINTFRSALRVLWSDHVVWTRNVIINLVDGAPGTNEAVARLLQNQVDIGNGIKPYYGDAAGNSLTALLTNHITVAADLIVSARDGDMTAYNSLAATWYANGDSIAAFLNTANPTNFLLADWQKMMKDHLDYTVEEVTARISHNYTADVLAYDKIYAEVMMMADMLANGIAAQFPNNF